MSLLAALQFLTRVPIRLRREPSLRRAIPWFPVAGTLIGLAVGGVAAGLWHVLPPLVAGAVAIGGGLLITGAFHEDGLADVADAFGGGWTVERRLEILKDPRHGSYGVAAMCTSIVVRIVALGSVAGPLAMLCTAVTAHAVGRAAAVVAMRTGGVDRDGLGADYARTATAGTAIVASAIGLAVAGGALALRFRDATAWLALAAVIGAMVVGTAAVVALARRKIGGITGDVLGATEQVVEILVMVVLAARW